MADGIELATTAISDLTALAGAFFFLVSAVGLLRLPDFFSRLHAPTKAATMGVILLGLSSALQSLREGSLVWLEDLAIFFFLCLTVPVSAQILARAAASHRLPGSKGRRARKALGSEGESGTQSR